MASRMDRYYKEELVTSGRSSKNKSLYDQIEKLENYTNIEGVATIEKTNEIDISKVKEMIKNREEYKKRRQLKDIFKEQKEEFQELEEYEEETKNYDIKDLLSKMELEVQQQEDKVRSLGKEQYELLKNLRAKDIKYDAKIDEEEEELKELINTINITKNFNELSDTQLDVGLLDNLKSDTMVGDAASIKKIIEEEKNELELENTSTDIDKDFYTSSFGFTKSDFEDLKNINQNIKKSNKFIIILLLVFITLLIISGILFLIFNR